jgi:hypothetical protein
MEKRFVRSESPVCEGGLIGYLDCSFATLQKVFGDPVDGSESKISTEWSIVDTQTGARFAIYDWKETNLYSDNLPSVEEFRALPSYIWHIGGMSKLDFDALTTFLTECNKE